MKLDWPLSIDLIFVELVLNTSVSVIEDRQSGILCQLQTAQLPDWFLQKSEKLSH